MFEDDPLEYIRQDLEPSTGQLCPDCYGFAQADSRAFLESDTRRQAATDFTRALMQLFESQITGIVGGHINTYLQVRIDSCHRPFRVLITCFLQQYAGNPAENWKSKDTAIYLLTSIASRGSTQHVSPFIQLLFHR